MNKSRMRAQIKNRYPEAEELMYLMETHLHTSEGSACASASGAEQAAARKQDGYTTIIVTDHFYRGNTRPDRNLPWEQYIDAFCSGYEHAKEIGDQIGLHVLFGFEDNYMGAEFLVYGLGKDWLKAHPEMITWSPSEMYAHYHEAGALVIQAHPFRTRAYLEGISLYPNHCDGIEVVNSSQTCLENEHAAWYAKEWNFPVTAGSDIHSTRPILGGMRTKKPITTIAEYIALIREQKPYELIDKSIEDWK